MEKHHSLSDIAGLIREIDIAAYLAISTAEGWQYLPEWELTTGQEDYHWGRIESSIEKIKFLCENKISNKEVFTIDFIIQPEMDKIKAEDILCKNEQFESTSALYDFIYTTIGEKYENEISCRELDAI